MLKKIRYMLNGNGHGIHGLCTETLIDKWYEDSWNAGRCTSYWRGDSFEFPECIECLSQAAELLHDKTH